MPKTPQERWEESGHTDINALRDGLMDVSQDVPRWVRDGILERMEHHERLEHQAKELTKARERAREERRNELRRHRLRNG